MTDHIVTNLKTGKFVCKAPIAETVMSDYIKGFDAGCDFIVREIETWSTKHQYDVIALLAHLRQGKGLS